MAEREPFSKRLFRRSGRVALHTPEGESVQGLGVIAALNKETGEIGGYRHALGNLTRPLAHFVGYLPEGKAVPGSVLIQGGQRYTVLDVRKMRLGEKEICLRALLERRDEDDDS